jgi:YHS domain-containing protein
MLNKFKLIGLAIALVVAAQGQALAVDEYNVSSGVTTDGVPLGLHGVDPVALTTLGAVAEGDAAFSVVHEGASYYFASRQAAETFKSDPVKYLPQYGGFCAYAVAKGKKFDGDPMFADIVGGKLYLFVNAAIFKEYKKNPREILARAEKTWPSIKHKAVDEL